MDYSSFWKVYADFQWEVQNKSCVATTYLKFFANIQHFVSSKLWCPEASCISTTPYLTLQREILPHTVAVWLIQETVCSSSQTKIIVPDQFLWTMTAMFLIHMILPWVGWFCPVIQPVFWKSSSSIVVSFSALSGEIPSNSLLLPPPEVEHLGHCITRQMDQSFSLSGDNMIFSSLG